ncbi:MAG: hypothetical protein RLZZ175_1356 [Bacteroidota bacterium]|jgi:hypothetical protein
MKKILFVLFCSISSLVNAQVVIPGFDEFAEKNPFDFTFGSYISNYNYESLNNKGVFYTIGAGLGCRYTLYSNKFMSIAPRLGIGGGYNNASVTSEYSVINYQVPLTMHLSFGGGSSKKSGPENYPFGFHLGAGYALNGFNIDKKIYGVAENQTTLYFAPIVYCCFKFKAGDYRWGIQPSYSYYKEDYTLGLHLFVDLID